MYDKLTKFQNKWLCDLQILKSSSTVNKAKIHTQKNNEITARDRERKCLDLPQVVLFICAKRVTDDSHENGLWESLENAVSLRRICKRSDQLKNKHE